MSGRSGLMMLLLMYVMTENVQDRCLDELVEPVAERLDLCVSHDLPYTCVFVTSACFVCSNCQGRMVVLMLNFSEV